jgi:prepilin-type processing-associated H-X9-DG protein
LPPNLEELIEKCDLSPKSLESKSKPKDFDGLSFIYIPGQTTSMDPGNIIAYENPVFLSEGTNVLYLDGHVAFVKPDEFIRDLEATYKRLGREMPEVKFKEGGGSSTFPFLR